MYVLASLGAYLPLKCGTCLEHSALGCMRWHYAAVCCFCMQGSVVLAQLVQQAAGRITIMAGGGVRSGNAAQLIAATGVKELHSSARM